METRCTICGGTLRFNKGDKYGVCDSCGRIQSIYPEKEKNQIEIDKQTNPLLKRTEKFLEESNWALAKEYSKRILDIDPECGRAYLYQLMSGLRITDVESLGFIKKNPVGYPSFNNAIKYADNELKEDLEYVCKTWIEIHEQEERKENYREAKKIINFASTSDDYAKAIEILTKIIDYKDSERLIDECNQKLKIIDNLEYGEIYDEATKLLNFNYDNELVYDLAKKYKTKYKVSKEEAISLIKKYEKNKNYSYAKRLLSGLPTIYKDTEYKIKECEDFLASDILFEKEKNQIDSLVNDEPEWIKEEKRNTKKIEKKTAFKIIPIFIVILIIVVTFYGLNFTKSKAKIKINEMELEGTQNPNLLITYTITNNSIFGNVDYLYFVVHVKDSTNNEIGTITTSFDSMKLNRHSTKSYISKINYQYNNEFYNKLCAYGTNLRFEYEIINITFGR